MRIGAESPSQTTAEWETEKIFLLKQIEGDFDVSVSAEQMSEIVSRSLTDYRQNNNEAAFDIADSWVKLKDEIANKHDSDHKMDEEESEDQNQMSESKIHAIKRPILELTLGKLKGASL